MILALSCGRDSPAELRSRLALDEAARRRLLRASRQVGGEIVVLCTCHRTEIYATSDASSSDALHVLAGLLPNLRPTDHHDLRFMEGLEAVEHLFRVACGLDSLVIGETQVLAQVRKAYVEAKEEGAAGPVLSGVFDRAIRLGRRVRSETSLGGIGQSIGSIAAEYLADRLPGLAHRSGAVVGAGQAAGDSARALAVAGAQLSVISRRMESAISLATEVGGTPHPLDDIPEVLERSDFAVVAVSGGLLIGRDDVPHRGDGEDPLVVLDLSVPPAVDIDGRQGVEMRTLEELPGPRGPEINTAVVQAEAIVRKELAELERWIDTRASAPAIATLRGRAEMLVRAEVARALAGMDLSPEDRSRIEALGMRIANKLLHGPTAALRDGEEETRTLIRRIFDLDP